MNKYHKLIVLTFLSLIGLINQPPTTHIPVLHFSRLSEHRYSSRALGRLIVETDATDHIRLIVWLPDKALTLGDLTGSLGNPINSQPERVSNRANCQPIINNYNAHLRVLFNGPASLHSELLAVQLGTFEPLQVIQRWHNFRTSPIQSPSCDKS